MTTARVPTPAASAGTPLLPLDYYAGMIRKLEAELASLRIATADVPQRDTFFKLTAQDNLEAQYKALLDRRYSGYAIAELLARYAEAGTYNRLTAEIEKLQAANVELEAKFETAKECAEIMGQMLENARGLLREHGIYEDEGDE